VRFIYAIVSAIIFAGCSKHHSELKTGIWRGVIDIQGHDLPFNFEVLKDSGNYRVNLKNASEKIHLDEISITNDTVVMALHIFDAQLKAKIESDSLKGFFIKNYEKDYKLPFKAAFNQEYRFAKSSDVNIIDFTGKYAVTFFNKVDTSTIAVGIFKQHGNNIEGTFLTPTGDYRYLEGSVIDSTMNLSAFDGNHAYIFQAKKYNDTLRGDYWSGKGGYESWVAIKDDSAKLPDEESLTYLKEGFDKIDFHFPDVDGKIVTPGDEKYDGKVVILQLFGTWCPNCLDETKFLAPWYNKNKNRGVEIIGLAYESKDDFNYASSRIKKMKNKLSVDYDFVIAGTSDKDKAAQTLPMLNTIIAFPTTIFIGKDGKVKKIHTGFSGPGTGAYYDHFIEHFNETVNELLAE
jgi:thiol-disulfide isomerase/thioredoxin